jgi:hypothetical protein
MFVTVKQKKTREIMRAQLKFETIINFIFSLIRVFLAKYTESLFLFKFMVISSIGDFQFGYLYER